MRVFLMHPDRLAPSLIAALLLACGPTPATTADASATSTSTSGETTDGVDPSTTLATTQSPTESPGSSGGPVTTTTTVASEVTATVTSDTGDTDEPCSFLSCDTENPCQMVPGLDGALRCSKCDVWVQDCPNGEKCSAWASDGGNAWNDTRCSPVAANPGKPGEPCTVEGSAVSGFDDCERGAMCWDVDPDTLMGTCIGLCDGSPDNPSCAEPKTFCLITNEGVLNLCLPTCDPLGADCPEGQVRIDTGLGDFSCAPGFPGSVGEPCEFSTACDPGLACIQSELLPGCEGDGCCSPFCSLPGPNTCPQAPNQVCTPWYEPGTAPEGYEDVGVCTLPQP